MKRMYEQEMPQERMQRFGVNGLTDADLIAMILRTGSRNQNVMDVANQLMNMQPILTKGIHGLYQIEEEDIRKIPGIGKIKTAQILCIMELSRRIAISSAKSGLRFNRPSTIAKFYMEKLRHENREQVLLILLDSKLQKIEDEVLSIGTSNSSLLSPREVFQRALRRGAVSIMVLHNHPSGDPTPSDQDRQITKQLFECGELMAIPILDHIIIGDNCYYSMKEHGLI